MIAVNTVPNIVALGMVFSGLMTFLRSRHTQAVAECAISLKCHSERQRRILLVQPLIT